MNRSTGTLNRENEKFLEKEREANNVRKQPITDLPYIKFNVNDLPTVETDDEYLKERFNTLNVLSEEDTKIVNLSSYTNTDLKLKYGVANLTVLTEYDQNFTNLCRCLYEIGKRLNDSDNTDAARAYLEYGIKCGTDLKLHYTLLADIYEQNMQYREIVALIKSADNINSVLKPALIRDLTKRLEGTGYSVSAEETPLEDIQS